MTNYDLKNRKLIIFDFDGTIVDFKLDYIALRSEIIDFLKNSYNLPSNFLSINERIFNTLDKVRTYLLQNNLKTNWNETILHVDNIMKKWEWAAARKNQINLEVIQTLENIKRFGFKIAIFTLEPEEIIDYLIKKHNIEHLIDLIAARDNVEKLKPEPEHLEYIIKKLNIENEKVIVIGDHIIDMMCGNNIKALCIGKRGNFHNDEELIKSGAAFVISRISDLNDLLIT